MIVFLCYKCKRVKFEVYSKRAKTHSKRDLYWKAWSLYKRDLIDFWIDFLFLVNFTRRALPLWRLRGCKTPKTPYFQRCCPQWPHIFAECLCCHPKTPHFLVKCELFDRSHPKTPYFLHSAVTGSYFLFQFHRQIDHFCHFRRLFLFCFCFFVFVFVFFCFVFVFVFVCLFVCLFVFVFVFFNFQIPAFKALTERSKVTFSPNAP